MQNTGALINGVKAIGPIVNDCKTKATELSPNNNREIVS